MGCDVIRERPICPLPQGLAVEGPRIPEGVLNSVLFLRLGGQATVMSVDDPRSQCPGQVQIPSEKVGHSGILMVNGEGPGTDSGQNSLVQWVEFTQVVELGRKWNGSP